MSGAFNAVDWTLALQIVLFVLGFVLVGIEMFMPGLQGPGIGGAISLLAGILVTAKSIKEVVLITLIVIAILILMFVVIVRVLSKGRENSKVVLTDELNTELGYLSSKRYVDLVGKTGVVISDLRPAGRAKIGDKEYDVVSDGNYIVKDTKIVVHQVEGVRIVVISDE